MHLLSLNLISVCLCLVLVISAWPLHSQNSDTLHLPLSPHLRHTLNPGGHGFRMLAKPRGDTLGFQGQRIPTHFPDLSQAPDTAFGTIYFPHQRDTLLPKTVFFLVTDYTSLQAKIWVDYNVNYDFRDDGPPLSFSAEDSLAVVKLKQPTDSLAELWVALMPASQVSPIKTDSAYWHRINNFFGNHPNFAGFERVPVDEMLANQSLSVVSLDTVIAGDSIRIGLFDSGSDGRFDETGQDVICVGQWGQASLSSDFYDGAAKWEVTGALIKPNQQVYRVLEVDPYGKGLSLMATDEAFPRLTVGDLIPNFDFVTHEGDSVQLHTLLGRKPYTLIDVWGSWCEPCRAAIPSLKALEQDFGDRLQILAITSDDSARALAFLAKEQVTWGGVWYTPEFGQTAHSGGFPSYLLIGPGNEILGFDQWPGQVRQYFEAQDQK